MKCQATVALSTTEVEYMALTCAAQQVLWMFSFMSEVSLKRELPAILHGNNAASIALTLNTKGHACAKHIDIHHHYIREQVAEGEIGLVQIPSEENLADILTKPLPRYSPKTHLSTQIGLLGVPLHLGECWSRLLMTSYIYVYVLFVLSHPFLSPFVSSKIYFQYLLVFIPSHCFSYINMNFILLHLSCHHIRV